YIRHRLDIAGYEGPEIFASSAIHLIAQRSQGIPRNINRICFNALSLGYALGCKGIGKKIVQEALNDLSLDNVGGKTRSGELPAALASPEPANPDSHQTTEKARFITYIVQPNDNISNLCEWSLGHYDEAGLAELRKLNPDLINADHIEVGDRLRLPVRHSN